MQETTSVCASAKHKERMEDRAGSWWAIPTVKGSLSHSMSTRNGTQTETQKDDSLERNKQSWQVWKTSSFHSSNSGGTQRVWGVTSQWGVGCHVTAGVGCHISVGCHVTVWCGVSRQCGVGGHVTVGCGVSQRV